MTGHRTIRAADLFCGAGGTSLGMLRAAREMDIRLDLVAVNHSPRAIETHMANHPWARHVCASLMSIEPPKDGQKTLFQCIDAVRPEEATRGKNLDLLVASPECTDHSNAKGGKPRNEQSRATPWCIPRWIEATWPRHIIIENVPEFRNWGPLGARGQPLKSKRGQLFKAFLGSLDALGYKVEWRILNAADHGDATTRRRFFLQAVRGRRKITWPDPTHAPADKAEELGLEPWRPARDVIDWGLQGRSIFGRKKPLVPNTIRRIAKGIEKYWGEWATPFLVMLYGTNDARSIERPLPTVTGGGQHIGLAEPFVMPISHGGKRTPRGVGDPLPTLTGAREQYLAEPLLVKYHGSHAGKSDGDGRVYPLAAPLPVQDTSNRYALAEPFIVPQCGGGTPRGVKTPLPTITTTSRGVGLAEPFLVPQFGERPGQYPRTHPVDEPLPAVTSHGAGAIVQAEIEPFLTKYYGTAGAAPVGEPLDTVTSKDRFALVEPGLVQDEAGNIYALDIRFRMLQPHELAAAMSFPADYEFTGNKSEQVKQIGNAVPVETATAICREALRP